MAEFVGLDAGGFPLYADGNGGTSGTPDFKSFVGKDALPDFNAGLSLNYRHKNWNVSANLASQFGGFYVYNATRNAFFTAGSIGTSRNVTQDVVVSGETNAGFLQHDMQKSSSHTQSQNHFICNSVRDLQLQIVPNFSG